MSPSNSSPSHEASSNSTTPPSEATLADNFINQLDAKVNKSNRSERPDGPATNIDSLENHDSRPNDICHDLSAVDDTESSSYEIGSYGSPECALLSYSRTNKADNLQSLLDAKLRDELSVNLNYKGHQKQNYSWSALHLACYFGNEQVVAMLLSNERIIGELDINIRNNSGDTPLHKAALTNRVRIVQLLLSNGANVFIKNCDGLSAKQLTSDKHIFKMLEASELADKNTLKQNMFKAVDNGDLRQLQEYFQEYDSILDGPELGLVADESIYADGSSLNGLDTTKPSKNLNGDARFSNVEFIHQMTDERGNTLLHLAAMRGFKAICIYLLEQGFDPYRKNNLGQTCIELSSYQLRQLFLSVKPAAGRLKELSKERVTRFEGPLLRKVRILGWKQMYVVLENGVIMLFNNRRDSMNRTRRGYKYLESAICEPSPTDIGMFTVRFSDNSRAIFLVSPNQLSFYTTFKLSPNDFSQHSSSTSQIELIRQKWVDSIRDHIVYSTEFIRKGLKLDDDDDVKGMDYDGNSLASLNHLLPIDTIKSFTQEARAHYSILERHAESLCNLAQSISHTNQQAITNSFDASITHQSSSGQGAASQQQPSLVQSSALPNESDDQSQTANVASNTSTSSRLLNFIRPNRQPRASSANDHDAFTLNRNRSSAINGLLARSRTNNTTNEFLQDVWPVLLFHLRLLMESAENTKTSMSQALALLEHQEQLRQCRIQDQEERCRVLEDSLQALARDHHELEKSLSVSQIYHSACRSVSLSTDLNEYHDAFEDFDDEKTMTPSSLPSDEELDKRIQDVINEEQRFGGKVDFATRGAAYGDDDDDDDDDGGCGDDGDDLESNCSALTVETVTDQYMSAADSSQLLMIRPDPKACQTSRTRLPAPMIPRDQVSIWSILKNCIGKELSKITMPVVFNEPLTMLQRSCEGIQYSQFLVMADNSNDPVERMEYVCAFIVASLSGNCLRIVKPFNPLLYETYEIVHELEDGTEVKGLSQQVSHHPPITAAFAESNHFSYEGVINPKIKFWGRSIEITHDGACRINLVRHKETYVFKAVACSIHNIIVGKLWFEHHGPLDVKCAETNLRANLTFKQAGWFSNDLHRFDGFISSGLESKNPKKLRFVYGKWSDYIKSVGYSDYENYLRDNQQKLFRIPDDPGQCNNVNGIVAGTSNISLSGSPNSVNNNSIPNNEKLTSNLSVDAAASTSNKSSGKKSGYTKSESAQSLDIPNSRTLWRLDTQFYSEYYYFSLFTMKLNELTPSLEQSLPRTDSRFRPDVRKLEEGDLDGAAREKQRLEEKQREARARDKRFKDPSPDMLWFEQESVPDMKEKIYVYKGGYWENRPNSDKFPELF